MSGRPSSRREIREVAVPDSSKRQADAKEVAANSGEDDWDVGGSLSRAGSVSPSHELRKIVPSPVQGAGEIVPRGSAPLPLPSSQPLSNIGSPYLSSSSFSLSRESGEVAFLPRRSYPSDDSSLAETPRTSDEEKESQPATSVLGLLSSLNNLNPPAEIVMSDKKQEQKKSTPFMFSEGLKKLLISRAGDDRTALELMIEDFEHEIDATCDPEDKTKYMLLDEQACGGAKKIELYFQVMVTKISSARARAILKNINKMIGGEQLLDQSIDDDIFNSGENSLEINSYLPIAGKDEITFKRVFSSGSEPSPLYIDSLELSDDDVPDITLIGESKDNGQQQTEKPRLYRYQPTSFSFLPLPQTPSSIIIGDEAGAGTSQSASTTETGIVDSRVLLSYSD